MPEPPHQPDMRSQDLPPQRPRVATSFVQGSPTVLLVIDPGQLPAALTQRQMPVAIENTPANARLRRDFGRLLRWQKWRDTYRLPLIVCLAVVVLMQMIIAHRYGLKFDWYVKLKVIEIGGKIMLTPQ